jgi:hypothetical protein
MKFKINFFSHIKQLKGSLIFLIILTIGEIYIFNLGGGSKEILIGIAIFMVLSLDVMFLHIRYWLLNKKMIVEILDRDTLRITVGDKIEVISSKDVTSLELNLTRPYYYKRVSWAAGETYNYANLRLKSGREYCITSLLSPNLTLPENFIDKSKKIKRWLSWP